MKYIIFEKVNKNSSLTDIKLIMPIMFPDHITHSQVKIKSAIPISAGFYKFNRLYDISVYGQSESLNLTSRSTDAEYIRRALVDMGTSFFLD